MYHRLLRSFLSTGQEGCGTPKPKASRVLLNYFFEYKKNNLFDFIFLPLFLYYHKRGEFQNIRYSLHTWTIQLLCKKLRKKKKTGL